MQILVYILLSITLSSAPPSSTHPHRYEPMEWQKMTDWRLYYSYSSTVASLSFDSLAKLPSKLLSQDTMSLYMEAAKPITPKTTPVWMDYYVLTCKTPAGTLMKVIVSQYGHFFYDPKSSQYYDVDERLANEWKTFLQSQWAQLESTAQIQTP